MAESEAKINKYIDQDLASKIGDLLDRGIHPGHQDFLPALDLKAGMGSHEAIVPRDEYGAFGRWTRNTFGYPKGEQALAEAQQLAKNLGGHMLLERGAALTKNRSMPSLGSLFTPGTPGQAGAPGNLQDVMDVVRGPQPAANPVGPELQTGAPDLQAGIQPPNAGQMLTMPTPAIAPTSATLGGVPVNPAAAATIERPDVSKMRIDPAHALTLLTQPHVMQHIIPEGGTLAITDAQGNVVNQIQNPNANYKHLGNDLTAVMKANNLSPDKPEDVAKARDIMLSEKPDVKSQNAAMEIVTKGNVTRFSDGSYQQKAEALKYAASIAPTARVDINYAQQNREVIPKELANVHGEDYLKKLPVGKANEVRAIADYQLSPAKYASMRTGAREELIQHVLQVNPGFNDTEYASRATAINQVRGIAEKAGGFEKTMLKNANLAETASAKLDRTGVPLFNKWLQAGQRKISANEDIGPLDIYLTSVAHEIARLATSPSGAGVTTDAEVKIWMDLIRTAQTPGQLKNNLDAIRKEARNRVSSYDEQIQEIKTGRRAPTGPDAAPAAGGWKIEKVTK